MGIYCVLLGFTAFDGPSYFQRVLNCTFTGLFFVDFGTRLAATGWQGRIAKTAATSFGENEEMSLIRWSPVPHDWKSAFFYVVVAAAAAAAVAHFCSVLLPSDCKRGGRRIYFLPLHVAITDNGPPVLFFFLFEENEPSNQFVSCPVSVKKGRQNYISA